jgi:hypothetical protein
MASGETSQPVESFVREHVPVERGQGMSRVAFVIKWNGGKHIQFFRRWPGAAHTVYNDNSRSECIPETLRGVLRGGWFK